MNMHLIAVIYKDKSMQSITGFRILDSDAKQMLDIDYEKVLNTLRIKAGIKINGIEYDKRKNDLRASNGAFDRYTALVNGLKKGNKVVILSSIDDKGFVVTNYMGHITCATSAAIIKVAEKVGIANGKVVTKGDKKYISAISGNYDNTQFKDIPNVYKEKFANIKHDIAMGESAKKQISSLKAKGIEAPKLITGKEAKESKLGEIDPDTKMTVEQKMVYGMMALKNIRPFYYSVYNCLNKVESTERKTMAVDLTTLYFNSDFVLDCSLGKILFVLIHEVCHVAMKHNIRRRKRNPKIWNIACDYYINSLIAHEFSLTVRERLERVRKADGKESNYKIMLPDDALYNPNIDVDVDTPEKIYEELMELRNKRKKQQQEDNNEGQPENGSGGGSSGNNKEQEQEDDGWEPEQRMVDSLDVDEDEDGEGENGDSGGDEQEDSEGKQGNGKGNKQDEDGEEDEDDLTGEKYRGYNIGDSDSDDLVQSKSESSESDDKAEQIADSILRRAITVNKQTFGSFGGPAGSFVERYVEKLVAPKINWKALLRNKLTAASQKINTFSAPDRRFLSRKMTLPGPKSLENDILENIKICVDTSGSIGNEELGIALGQIDQLFKQFKVKAELLYWDTSVRATYEFKNVKELMSKKPLGGGGTDVNCVFAEFEKGDYKNFKKKKPSVIIIFTDGYFGSVDEKYKKYKDTIWILQAESYSNFKEPFGVKAPINPKDVV